MRPQFQIYKMMSGSQKSLYALQWLSQKHLQPTSLSSNQLCVLTKNSLCLKKLVENKEIMCVCVCVVLRIKPRALCIVGKHSTTELHPQSKNKEIF
jgi:hypothetical protein